MQFKKNKKKNTITVRNQILYNLCRISNRKRDSNPMSHSKLQFPYIHTHHIHKYTHTYTHSEPRRSVVPGEALRQLSQAVQRIEVWALAISGQRLAVKLYSVYRVHAGLIQVPEGGRRHVKPPEQCIEDQKTLTRGRTDSSVR